MLLLEKQSQLGGTTGIAVGSFSANRTRLQQQAGIRDDVDAHVEDAGKFAPADIEARNAETLRRFFLSHSAETLHWLMGDGACVFEGRTRSRPTGCRACTMWCPAPKPTLPRFRPGCCAKGVRRSATRRLKRSSRTTRA